MTLTDIYNILSTPSLADYLLLVFVFIMIILSIKQGSAKSLLNLVWFVVFFIIASNYYYLLSNALVLKYLIIDSNNRLILSFIIIMLVLYGLRFAIYSLINKSLAISNPCWFNGITFWLLVIIISNIVALISYKIQIVDIVLNFFNISPANKNSIAYITIILAIIGLVISVVSLFNIKLTLAQKCILMIPYQKLLACLHSIAHFLNHKNPITFLNFTATTLIGIVRALILVIFALLVLRNFTISNSNFWSDTLFLHYLQDCAVILEQYFSKQLLFL